MIRLGLPLLRLAAAAEERFVNVRSGRTPPPPQRDRTSHAASLLSQIDGLVPATGSDVALAGASGVSVTATGVHLADVVTSLRDRKTGVTVLDVHDDRAVLRVPQGLSSLRRKVEQYGDEETRTGKPKNQALVARLEKLALTTLADLSNGELSAIQLDSNTVHCVEVWTPSEPEVGPEERTRARAAVLALSGLAGNERPPEVFEGPDRDIHLVRLSGDLLRRLPELVPDAAEVHQAARGTLVEAAELADYRAEPVRVEAPNPGAPAIAVHDTGVAVDHPYLQGVLLGAGSAVPAAGPEDLHGHGTEMAGVAAFSDMAVAATSGVASADAWLVSMRLIETDADRQGGDEDRGVLWSERTALSVEEAEHLAAGRAVVHSISIGATNPRPGERTAWSIAVDDLAWNDGSGRLLVVAAGNADPVSNPADYPAISLGTPHEDPAQSWNALTVGAYTLLAQHGPEDMRLGAGPPLAAPGQLSPYTSTSPGGPGGRWNGKPEVVMEGGNSAPTQGLPGTGMSGLSLLTTGRPSGPSGALLARTWATSPAAAAASNALARVIAAQPMLRPATVKALLVHTARWPEAARAQLPDARDLLRSFGYGVPDPARASSASNRPVMIYEGELAPGAVGDDGKPDRRAVFVELPMPEGELDDIAESYVEIAVTLVFFAEPTASRARRSYAGARARWDMQGPTETADGFRSRISQVVRDQGVEQGGGSFDWQIGPDTRSRGTTQHDRATVPAGAVAGVRLVAIYPVLGWWDTSRLTDRTLPFSLVASVDLGDVDVDLHAVVSSSLDVVVDVST